MSCGEANALVSREQLIEKIAAVVAKLDKDQQQEILTLVCEMEAQNA